MSSGSSSDTSLILEALAAVGPVLGVPPRWFAENRPTVEQSIRERMGEDDPRERVRSCRLPSYRAGRCPVPADVRGKRIGGITIPRTGKTTLRGEVYRGPRDADPVLTVMAVDGDAVRRTMDPAWKGIGHPGRWAWIPDGELWISTGDVTPAELPYAILRALTEYAYMQGGSTYALAVDFARHIESKARIVGLSSKGVQGPVQAVTDYLRAHEPRLCPLPRGVDIAALPEEGWTLPLRTFVARLYRAPNGDPDPHRVKAFYVQQDAALSNPKIPADRADAEAERKTGVSACAIRTLEEAHRHLVEDAVRAGKPVPEVAHYRYVGLRHVKPEKATSTIFDRVRVEHGIVRDLCKVLHGWATAMEKPKARVSPDDAAAIAYIMREGIGVCHQAREDDLLFPLFLGTFPGSDMAEAIVHASQEHIDIEPVARAVVDKRGSQSGKCMDLAACARLYADRTLHHITDEDKKIYNVAEQRLSGDALARLEAAVHAYDAESCKVDTREVRMALNPLVAKYAKGVK